MYVTVHEGCGCECLNHNVVSFVGRQPQRKTRTRKIPSTALTLILFIN
jgi:hypothetical protein